MVRPKHEKFYNALLPGNTYRRRLTMAQLICSPFMVLPRTPKKKSLDISDLMYVIRYGVNSDRWEYKMNQLMNSFYNQVRLKVRTFAVHFSKVTWWRHAKMQLICSLFMDLRT